MIWRAVALTLLLVGTASWAGSTSDVRLPPSPRTFVRPASCNAETPCPRRYWVFRPPNCQDGSLSHPPGTAVMFENETIMQCRCRLTWVRTKRGEPPDAKVSCRWVDLDEAAKND